MSFFTLDQAKIDRDEFTEKGRRQHSCTTCGLFKDCHTPKFAAQGQGKKRILVIGDLITKNWDVSGGEQPGAQLIYLKKAFKEQGIDLERDCWYTPAIKCQVSETKLKDKHISACNVKLIDEIRALNPAIIVPTSPVAWQVLLHQRMVGRAQSASFFDYSGEFIPDQDLRAWVAPIFYPKMVMDAVRTDGNNRFNPIFGQQIRSLLTLVNADVPVFNVDPMIRVITRLDDAIDAIMGAWDWPEFAFDYETTSIKPHHPRNEIVMVSLSNGKISYAFPWFDDEVFISAIKRLFENKARKIAHNSAFERSWTRVKAGIHIKGSMDDPMLMLHVKNNWKPANLKFGTYANFGILGYDGDTDQYMKADPDDTRKYKSHATNRMKKAPLRKALRYNAEDSLYTYWLRDKLRAELHPVHQLPGYEFFREAQWALDVAHANGLRVDMDVLARAEPEVQAKIDKAYEIVVNDRHINRIWNWDEPFSPRSDRHLRHLIYDLEGIEPFEWTEGGKGGLEPEPSVDSDTLQKIVVELPILKPLLEFRRWFKVMDYLNLFRAEQYDGWLHPNYNLFGVRTFRSSSSSPNFQNIPKRDKAIKKLLRSMLFARKGHKIIEYDFKSMEVCIAAAVTGDKNLIKYVSDLSTDMHLDSSVTMFMLEKSKVSKALRNVTKNAFVFASFYGSYFVQTAKDIWEQISVDDPVAVFGLDVKKHLKSKGITCYEDWERHVEKQEHILWNDRFPDYQKYREETYELFKKQGYIDYPNGFRYFGPSGKNQVLNSPVQGPAFHVQLWAFTEITRIMEERGMRSRFMGQIHDAMVADVHPDEEDMVDALVLEYATLKVRKHWDWISVPLVVEKEASPVDGSWAEMEAFGFLGVKK